MKEKSKEILPGIGIGKIKFGINSDECIAIAGQPDEKESYEQTEPEVNKTEAWHYDDPEVSFAFEEFNNWNLTSIAISSPEYTLEGFPLIGISIEKAKQLLKQLNIGEIFEEDCSSEDSPELWLISVDDAGLNLWFEKNELTEVQISQIWEENEE